MVDFHWNVLDPWTIVSVSDNCESSGGGGTLQVLLNVLLHLLGDLPMINFLGKFENFVMIFNYADMADE